MHTLLFDPNRRMFVGASSILIKNNLPLTIVSGDDGMKLDFVRGSY
jgi:hypothetical protein